MMVTNLFAALQAAKPFVIFCFCFFCNQLENHWDYANVYKKHDLYLYL